VTTSLNRPCQSHRENNNKSVPVIYPQQTAAQMVSCPQHLPISPDYHEGFLWPQLFVSSLPTHDQPPTNHKLLASYNKNTPATGATGPVNASSGGHEYHVRGKPITEQ